MNSFLPTVYEFKKADSNYSKVMDEMRNSTELSEALKITVLTESHV